MRGARELSRGRGRAWALTGLLAALPAPEEEKSYAVWFVVVIAVLLLLLASQAWVAIRRDRRLAREREDDEDADVGPAYVEDTESPGYAVDALGDVDDLQVHEYTVRPRVDAVAPADDGGARDDGGEEAEEVGADGSEPEQPAPVDEPDEEPESEAPDEKPGPKPKNKRKGKGKGEGEGEGEPRKS